LRLYASETNYVGPKPALSVTGRVLLINRWQTSICPFTVIGRRLKSCRVVPS